MTDVRTHKQRLVRDLLQNQAIDRGSWQSRATAMTTRELNDVLFRVPVEYVAADWQRECESDDWAEQHFQERISGQPLNPAPSYVDWPWHSEKYREQFKQPGEAVSGNPMVQPFDHTYPERIWPKHPDRTSAMANRIKMRGIRFDYGDLNDVISLLKRDPFTRQAFLPIWFPEDTGSTAGQRVPCTIGYHFIRNGSCLDIKYMIRSCDITRHFSNDVYMAGRLLQHVSEACQDGDLGTPFTGDLTMYISNLHMFTNDEWRYQ